MMSTERDLMRIVIVGHVDHGKSTLVGRLFHDTGSLPDGKLEQIKAMCERRGMPFEWAFLMDAFQSERDQGITIDTAQIWFKTPKRDYTIIDAPGHREFIKNMITGASSAEAAIMLIDASHGVQQQSRTHAFLLNLLGIRQIVVVVNKMDLVGSDEKTFQAIKAEYVRYLEEIGIVPNFVIPAVARDGDNVVHRSERMGWYDDATLIAGARIRSRARATSRRCRCGCRSRMSTSSTTGASWPGGSPAGASRSATGILFSPSNKTARVRSIEAWNAALPGEAEPGQSDRHHHRRAAVHRARRDRQPRGRRADRDQRVPRPPVLAQPQAAGAGRELPPAHADQGRAGDGRADRGDLRSRRAGAAAGRQGRAQRDRRRGAAVLRHAGAGRRGAQCRAPAGSCWATGPTSSPAAPSACATIRTSASWSRCGRPTSRRWRTALTNPQRIARNGHTGGVLWFTGLSGAGKSTIAMAVEQELFKRGYQTYVLDGDNVRRGLNSNLSFSPEDRAENIRRVGEVAALFADAGQIVVTAFISPYRSDRHRARAAGKEHFHEIYIKASLETCEKRDPKGLYRRARTGEIAEFTGVTAPYETPESPELTIDTDRLTIEESVAAVLEYIDRNFRKTA